MAEGFVVAHGPGSAMQWSRVEWSAVQCRIDFAIKKAQQVPVNGKNTKNWRKRKAWLRNVLVIHTAMHLHSKFFAPSANAASSI